MGAFRLFVPTVKGYSLRRVLFWGAALASLTALVVPPTVAMARPSLGTPPSVSLGVPAQVPVGQNVDFTVTFDNVNPVDPGYGPILDVILDTTGADAGAGGGPFDGLGTTTITASYLGIPFSIAAPNPTMWIVTFDALGQATHPLMRSGSGSYITVNGTPGDKLVVLRLPFGSFTPSQPPATVAMTVNMSTFADVGTPLSIQARGLRVWLHPAGRLVLW